jgi:epoxyqueuosine reductase
MAKGKIARYAGGVDYHDVIGAKLTGSTSSFAALVDSKNITSTTGPVLERDHAAQAGIGWHGKSTMLIDDRLGTWFFLAGNL